jgi:DNA repair protein RadD
MSEPGALRPLRPHQERALAALRASLAAGKRRPMLQAPTGFGKTLTAAHIIRRALDKGKRVAFVVPRLSLIDQTVEAFWQEGVRAVGVMQGQHPLTDGEQPVQVVSAQTLGRRSRPKVDLVLIDEAHELHGSVLSWLTDPEWARVPFLGLSATPWSRGLGKYYDELIVAATTQGLIDCGFLSPFVVYAPSEPDLSSVRIVAGEFEQHSLGEAMDRPKPIGDIIEEWGKRGEDRPTLVYCVNRSHARHIAERFVEIGAAAEYMDGETPRQEREETFVRFRAGETRVLCNVGVLTTGIDLPMVSCVVDAKPTKSRILFVHTLGRGLRTAPGKDKLLVLDHAGNCLRLGLPTDIHQQHLDDGSAARDKKRDKKERSEPLPKLCDECKAVIPPRTEVCPGCGAPVLSRTAVEHEPGELGRVDEFSTGYVFGIPWLNQA